MQTLLTTALFVSLAFLPYSGDDGGLPPVKGIDALALHVWTGEGNEWCLAAELAHGTARALLPLSARSPHVVRMQREASGYRLRITSLEGGAANLEALHVLAFDHPTDHQVLLLDDAAHLVGPPILPYRATAATGDDGELRRDVLPELARLDLIPARGTSLSFEAPAEHAGLHWILQAHDRDWIQGPAVIEVAGAGTFEVRGGRRRALALPASERLELEMLEGALDQVFLAQVTALEPTAWRALELRSIHGVSFLSLPRRRFPGSGATTQRGGIFGSDTSDAISAKVLEGGKGIRFEQFHAAEIGVDDIHELPPGLTRTLLVEVVGNAGPMNEGLCVLWYPRQSIEIPTPAEWAARKSGRREPVDPGLDLVHFEGPDEQLDIRPTMGPGVAAGDYDGDGWVDVYLVQGGGRAGSVAPTNKLMRNRGDGTFEDVSFASGTAHDGAGMSALFFDVDGDGDLDLYVANYGPDVLYENMGDGTFRDVSAEWGVGGDFWSAGIAAADFDRDGDLDLYITSYLDYDTTKMPPLDELGGLRREDPVEMLPFAFPGQRNVFLKNRVADAVDPARAFVDATDELGLADAQGRGMQPVFWDFDLDGDMDLYVANDVSPNVLWRNEGDGTFRDISFQTGMDDPRGGMGVVVGDVDGDLDEDLFLTNWELEPNALYLNNLVTHREGRHRVATFRDGVVRAGLGSPSVGVTSWGCVLFDMDLDGDLDLFVANGYTSPDYESTGICVGQPDHLFVNDGTGRFELAKVSACPDVFDEFPSRSALAIDHDQDGMLDLLVTTNNGPVRLLRNRAERAGNWLGVRLRGQGANTHAIGARVVVKAGEREFLRVLGAGTSYLAGNAPELHFGLGAVEGPVEVHVAWPSGATSVHEVEPGRYVTLREE